MALGVVGQKRGMTRIFTEDGVSVPVSVIEILPNKVTQVKTKETDGYPAVQVTTGTRRRIRVKKPLAGIFAKANVEAGRGLWEFRLGDSEAASRTPGSEITVEMFQPGQKVHVSGTTIGKGYAGTIKRHHFSSGDATHGNSLAHRLPGSIGQCQTPGRVLKGKRMSGHMGDVRRTVRNLEVVRVDAERKLLLIKGAVPGARGGNLLIRPASAG